LKSAQDGVRQISPITSGSLDFDIPSAYAVARLIHEARLRQGEVPVGRKIGFTNPDMWSRYGVREPIWGYMYDSTVVRASHAQYVCPIDRFAEPKIEPEIVFHFQSAPPVGGDLPAILKSIDWVAHGFEVVQSHFPSWTFQAADTIADQGLHGMLLVGESRPLDRLGTEFIEALASFSVSLACNRVVREVGVGSNVLGSPLAAIAYLIDALAKQPQSEPLQAGEMVTTGTITTAQPIAAGEIWTTELQGIALPGMAVQFVDADLPRC
jgi:2-keto-4-pentenoate hydratase